MRRNRQHMQKFAAIGTDIVQEIAQTRQKPLPARKVSVLHTTEEQYLPSERRGQDPKSVLLFGIQDDRATKGPGLVDLPMQDVR